MKVLNPAPNGETSIDVSELSRKEAQASVPVESPAAEHSGEKPDDTLNDIRAAYTDSLKEMGDIGVDNRAGTRVEDDIGGEADVGESTEDDPLLSVAEEGIDHESLDDVGDITVKKAPIEQRHKDAFIDSVITGGRYTEEFTLFGGKLKLKIRARSVAETDAITAYARRMIATDKVKVDYEYSALMRKLLASAQVDEINGVKNPPLESPLFFEETEDGINPPAWEGRLAVWGQKPEVVVIAVTKCILEFEARYWHMIRHVNDENFWLPGESTGE